jgi:hypothetical protein
MGRKAAFLSPPFSSTLECNQISVQYPDKIPSTLSESVHHFATIGLGFEQVTNERRQGYLKVIGNIS